MRTGTATSKHPLAVAEDAVDARIEVDEGGGVVEALQNRLPCSGGHVPRGYPSPQRRVRTFTTAGL